MSILPFQSVDFEKDAPVTREDLDAIQNNYQWIMENTPRGRYYRPDSDRPARDAKIVLLVGREQIPKSNQKDTAKVSVKFPKAFAPSCKPHVTTGVVCDFTKKVFCTVSGLGTNKYPNANGFEIHVRIHEGTKKDKISQNFWVHWHAFGWRMDDMNEF